jgi:putative transcriptional regulator
MAPTIRVSRAAAAFVLAAAAVALGATLSWGRQGARETIFLVARPELRDPLFQEAVILMLPPDRLPLVVGLIVNKPVKVRLHELFPQNAVLKNRADTAYFGGPVDVDAPSLVFREASAPVKATPLFDNVYVSLDPKLVAGMLKGKQLASDLRLYLGRAQWSLNQLYGEMLEGSWYIVPAEPAFVFSADPQTVWPALVKRAQMHTASSTSEMAPYRLPVLFFPAIASPAEANHARFPGNFSPADGL